MIEHTIERMPSTVFERLDSNTLRGRIAKKIRAAILDGTLKEGERLVERQLAAQFGASLTAVREALIELETEGFIVKRPNATTSVTKLSLADLEKIFAVRQILERTAVQEAARRATDAQVAKLERQYLELIDTARAEDSKLYVQRDFEWHESLWHIADNEYLEAALRRVVVPIFAVSAMHVAASDPLELLRDAQSHMHLLNAIKSRDAEAAIAALDRATQEWHTNTKTYIFGRDASAGGHQNIRSETNRALAAGEKESY